MVFHYRIEGRDVVEVETKKWGQRIIAVLPKGWEGSSVVVIKK